MIGGTVEAKLRDSREYVLFHDNGKMEKMWLQKETVVKVLQQQGVPNRAPTGDCLCQIMAYGHNLVMLLPKHWLVFGKKVLKIESSDPNISLDDAIKRTIMTTIRDVFDNVGRNGSVCTNCGPLRFSIETEEM